MIFAIGDHTPSPKGAAIINKMSYFISLLSDSGRYVDIQVLWSFMGHIFSEDQRVPKL